MTTSAIFLYLLLVLLPSTPAPSRFSTGMAPPAAEAEEFLWSLKRTLHERINRNRLEHGAQAVLFSRDLSLPADLHRREMLEEDSISHWNREGWKPYMRYSQGGLLDHTEENVSSIRSSRFDLSPEQVEREMLARHEALVNEKPPFDLHRRSILDPTHTHVGIGLAFDETGMRLIEVLFTKRYVDLQRRATQGSPGRLTPGYFRQPLRGIPDPETSTSDSTLEPPEPLNPGTRNGFRPPSGVSPSPLIPPPAAPVSPATE